VPHEYAITLGAGATTPLRLTTAYSMIVNGGKRITASVIDRVQDRDGKTIWRADDRRCDGCSDVEWQQQPVPAIPDNREQVADPGSAYQLVTMMQGVVERGTGTAVKAVGKPIAGKTGTTNEYRDAWFVGFSPDLAAGVYVGYDQPDSLGKDETGGHVAAPIFRDFMIDALRNTPAIDFRIPPGLRLYRVSAATGLPVAGNEPAIFEAYKPGTEPGKNRQLATRSAAGEEDAPPNPATADTTTDDAATGPGPSADTQSAGTAAAGNEPAPMAGDAGHAPGDSAPAGNDSDIARAIAPASRPSAAPPARGAPASGTGGLY
jgi:penicillin-binding protein 1A